ncbi:MAG: chorismate mutase [Candidatus Delongbacteria bacterium]|nr:chorismate mutase [Candidatus Delongbacteria bacterium]
MKKYRDEIDSLDTKIAELLRIRFKIAEKLRAIKKEIRDEKREAEILNNLRKRDNDELYEHIEQVYKTIFNESVKIQKKL